MKKVLVISLLVFLSHDAFNWGFYSHKRINRVAVFALPPELFSFYKAYIDYIEEHSIDADKRRHSLKDEATRHYIDIDYYGQSPFDSVPQRWKDAVTKFSEDTIKAYGTVPWHIQRVYYQLVDAFNDRDRERILKLSADLGHYIGDAHVPLHTTLNYNGQLTGQKGIHSFWESRLPELYAVNYNYVVNKANYRPNILTTAWSIVKASHYALDSVLAFEDSLSKIWDADLKYAYVERGNSVVKTYSEEYSFAYHKALNGMVERRMRSAIHEISSAWYSAWVESGQPDLKDLIDEKIKREYLKKIQREKRSWKKGDWIGRPED